jgi:hypothetical protein
MIYVGLDMSINSPGLTIIDGDSIEYHFRYDMPKRKKVVLPDNFFAYPICDSKDDMTRYVDNADWIMDKIAGREAVVCIEGYAMAAQGRVFNIAENCAVTKYELYKAGIQTLIQSPGSIKKFATGNGAAKKGLMLYHFQRDTGIDLYAIFGRDTAVSPLTDIADSYFMAKFAQKTMKAVD